MEFSSRVEVGGGRAVGKVQLDETKAEVRSRSTCLHVEVAIPDVQHVAVRSWQRGINNCWQG